MIRSRKQALVLFIVATAVGCALLLASNGRSLSYVHALYVLVGLFAGYWAVFITTAAEQFGTNLRATVATSIPNFVRGMVVPMTLLLKSLKSTQGLISAASVVLALVVVVALLSVAQLKESFFADLNFVEE